MTVQPKEFSWEGSLHVESRFAPAKYIFWKIWKTLKIAPLCHTCFRYIYISIPFHVLDPSPNPSLCFWPTNRPPTCRCLSTGLRLGGIIPLEPWRCGLCFFNTSSKGFSHVEPKEILRKPKKTKQKSPTSYPSKFWGPSKSSRSLRSSVFFALLHSSSRFLLLESSFIKCLKAFGNDLDAVSWSMAWLPMSFHHFIIRLGYQLKSFVPSGTLPGFSNDILGCHQINTCKPSLPFPTTSQQFPSKKPSSLHQHRKDRPHAVVVVPALCSFLCKTMAQGINTLKRVPKGGTNISHFSLPK